MTRPTGNPRGRPPSRALTAEAIAALARRRLALPQLQELRRLLALEAQDRLSGRTPSEPRAPRTPASLRTE